MDRRTYLVGGVAGLGALAGCTGLRSSGDVAREVVEDSFDPQAVDGVEVSNDIGDVVVRTGAVESVETRVLKRSTNGTRGLNDIEATATLVAGTLTVRTSVARDASWFSRSSPSTDVTVTLPPGAAGPQVETVSSRLGDVTLSGTRGDTDVGTRLGEVLVDGVDGYPRLESNLGDVVVRNTTGLSGVRTDLGRVNAELRDVRSNVEVRTELGDVLLDVATDLAVDLVAVGEGSIESALALSDERRRDGRLTGRLNGGGPELRVVTELGRISLRPL